MQYNATRTIIILSNNIILPDHFGKYETETVALLFVNIIKLN